MEGVYISKAGACVVSVTENEKKLLGRNSIEMNELAKALEELKAEVLKVFSPFLGWCCRKIVVVANWSKLK